MTNENVSFQTVEYMQQRIEELHTENLQLKMNVASIAADERAKIVAWLMREEEGYPSSEYSGFAAMIREEIEAGEHLK